MAELPVEEKQYRDDKELFCDSISFQKIHFIISSEIKFTPYSRNTHFLPKTW